MKSILKISICTLLISVAILFSCKKDLVPLDKINTPPIANAGPDQSIRLPIYRVFLDGSASSDPEDNIISYHWTNLSGPSSILISRPSTSRPFIIDLVLGVYQFELKVTDDKGLSASDTVQISVKEGFPVANAGPDQTITLPLDSTYLDGSKSFLSNWLISSGNKIVWTKISGPSPYVLSPVSIDQTFHPFGYLPNTILLKDIIPGIYLFRLQVTNSAGTDADTVQINVVNDPQDINTIIYHELVWEQGEDYLNNGVFEISLLTPYRPDLFYSAHPNNYAVKPIQVFVYLNAKWDPVPFDRLNDNNYYFYTYDQTPLQLQIIYYPGNKALVGKKSDIKIKLL